MSGPVVRCRFRAPRSIDGAETAQEQSLERPAAPTRIAQMLALAHHVEGLVEAGEVESYAAVARALELTRARMTQVMDLLLLAPAVQERILTGDLKASERSLRRVIREPTWKRQCYSGRTRPAM